jgi:integrase/recombinase XerD
MHGIEIRDHFMDMGITPVTVHHRGLDVVLLRYNDDPGLDSLVKQFKGQWTRTHGCRYVPRHKPLLERLLRAIARMRGKDIERHETKEMVALLELKGYSSNTIRNYRNAFSLFLDHIYPDDVACIERKRIEDFLLFLFRVRKYSETAIHTMINAIKFYLEHVIKKPKEFYDIPRPQRPLQLPKVLSEQEIGRLFNAVRSRKHKAILFLAYSAGLRVSEVVQLRLCDIDSDRMQIFVQRAKGKKDRYVPLSLVVLDVLRQYLRGCMVRPLVYLFEGAIPGQPYSTRSAQKIFQVARKDAGITKEVSFHALRHSYATHILEKGIDIRYIRDLLGHFNITTTERYLHVKREQLVTIESPLDALWKSGKLKW